MSIPKNFLLIEHGGYRKQFVLDELLSTKDIVLYVATTSAPDWLHEVIPSERIIITDTYNSVKLLADVVSFMEAEHVDFSGVGTFFEHTVTQTADLASALRLPGIDPGAARRSSSNKLLMRRTLRDAGVPTPRIQVLRELNASKLINAVSEVGLPCVLKPIFGSESYGTVKIENGFDADQIVSEVLGNVGSEKKEVFKNFENIFILEEYLAGKVISVDGVVHNGQVYIAGIVEFVMGPEPRFTQEVNYIPAHLTDVDRNSAEEMAITIIKSLGLNQSGFHCEMRMHPERGPILLEIAARLPGGPLQPGHLESSGVNLTQAMLRIWLGETPDMTRVHERFIIQKAVFPSMAGVVTSLQIPESLREMPGVLDISPVVSVGETLTTYPDIPKPLYYYAVSAETIVERDRLARHVENSITHTLR